VLNIIYSILVCIVLFIILLSFGALVSRFTLSHSIFSVFIVGFLFFFSISHFIVLPMVLTKQTLLTASISLLIVTFICVIFSIILNRKKLYISLKKLKQYIKKMPKIFYVATAVVAFQMIIVVCFGYNDADDYYYTAEMSTSLHTDTLNLYDPYTGNVLSTLNLRYAVATFTMVCSIICKWFSLHPLLFTRIVLPIILIMLVNVIYFEIGKNLFPKNVEWACVFIIVACVVNIFGNQSIYTSSRFLFTRIAQGKSILANVLIPILILFCIKIYKKRSNRAPWINMFLLTLSGNMFTLSSMFVIPIALGSFCVPMAIGKRDVSVIRNMLICLIPCIVTIILYYLHISGLIMVSV
jgi:small-conductance mechanosensitive channel